MIVLIEKTKKAIIVHYPSGEVFSAETNKELCQSIVAHLDGVKPS